MAQVSFSGSVGKIIQELKFSEDGKARLAFSVGESTREKGRDGQWGNSPTTWWAVTVFGKAAENLTDTLAVGTIVTVTGRSKTREYQAKDGSTGRSLDVIADTVGIVPVGTGNSQRPASGQNGAGWGNQPQNDPWGAQPSGGAGGWGSADAPY